MHNTVAQTSLYLSGNLCRNIGFKFLHQKYFNKIKSFANVSISIYLVFYLLWFLLDWLFSV